MRSNDNTPGSRRELPYLPVPFSAAPPKPPRFAALRTWWKEAWEEDGVLHEMWEDVLSVPEDGFRDMAPWLRAVLMVAGVSFVVLMARAAGEVILQALHQLLTAVPKVQVGVDTSHGVFAVVDQPVRTYIAAHSAGLPISASTAYTLWQVTGLFALIAGFITRSNGVRLTWTAWGCADIAMVWTTTPETSRTVATGIAVLAWTLAGAFALRGLNLRPRVFTSVHTGAPQIEVRPEIHIPVQHPAALADNHPHNGCPFRD